MMMRGLASGGYAGPALGGYDTSRGGYGNAALRGTRELYDPYRHLHRAGPSPLVPATILGVIFFITAMPYMQSPDLATVDYYRQSAVRASSFPMPLLWIPVVGVIALQFFGASDWYRGVYIGDRHGARPGIGYQSGAYGRGGAMAPGGAYNALGREGLGWRGSGWWPWSGPSSWNHPYNRYNTHLHRGVMSRFMDYGGHWFLIVLGVAEFTLVSSSSLPASVPLVPLAPRTLGFPWSWFF